MIDELEATYTVPLAVFDLVPVVLGFVGCLLLARLAARALPAVGLVALLGAVLIGLGGLAKAGWKILLTTAQVDLGWLEQSLFPLLSVGFVLLLWSLWSAIVGRPIVLWPFVLVLALGIVGALAARTMTPLLGVAAGSALMVSGVAIRWAVRDRLPVAVVLYVLGMAASLGLAYLAGPKVAQTSSIQWVEESLNTVGQLCFVIAAALLWRRGAPPHPSVTRTGAHSSVRA